MSRPATLGDLRASGWESRPVKEEIRANAVRALAEERRSSTASSATRTPCCRSSRTRCSPATTSSSSASAVRRRRASSASSSVCSTSGCRSSRAARSTTTRTRPVVARTRAHLVAERGDDTPIEWVHRDRRYGEKLATPDTSIADLIGEVDPIKVAEGRYLSDELTIHYGLVPAHEPRHLRDQRAARPRRAHPGRSAERARRARRADPRLQDPPAARRAARRVGEPRGLHEPRPHHHAAEGPLRFADPHALPARDRARDGDHRPGSAAARGRGPPGVGARLHDRDRRRDLAARAALAARQPAVRCVGAALDLELRDAGRERGPARAARTASARSCRASPTSTRSPRRRRARSRSRRSTTAARARCSSASSRRRRSRCSGRGCGPSGSVRSSPRSRTVRSCTPARTCPPPSTAICSSKLDGMPAVLSDLGVGESPAGIASGIEFVLEGLHLTKRLNKDAVGTRASYRSRG